MSVTSTSYLKLSHLLRRSQCILTLRKTSFILPSPTGLRLKRNYSESQATGEIETPPGATLSRPKSWDKNDRVDIGTLTPSKLTESDHVEITGSRRVFIGVRDRPDLPAHRAIAVEGDWPPSAKGFFYVRTPPEGCPVSAASLRFRVTDSADPKSFDAGHDLLYKGLPFNAPFIYGMGSAAEELLAQHLSKDVLTNIAHHARLIWKLPQAYGWYLPHNTSLIYAKRQPFLFRFGRRKLSPVWLIQGTGDNADVSCLRFHVPYVNLTKTEYEKAGLPIPLSPGKKLPLYDGTAIVNFDDDLQRLRILKIVDLRQQYELEADVQKPIEGDYIPVYDEVTREAQPLTSFRVWGSNEEMLQQMPDLPPEPEFAHLLA